MANNSLYDPFKQLIANTNLLYIAYIFVFCEFLWFHDIDSDYVYGITKISERNDNFSSGPRWIYWELLGIGNLDVYFPNIPNICELVYNTILTFEMVGLHSFFCWLNASKYSLAQEKYMGPFWYAQFFGLVSILTLKNVMVEWFPVNTVLFDFTTQIGFLANCNYFPYFMQIFGLFGLLFALYSDLYLLNFVTKNPGKVCDQNIYQYIRHPIYTGLIIFYLSRPIITVGSALFSGLFISYILMAVHFHEEARVVRQLGNEYVAYMKRVPRYLPKIGCSKFKKD